MDIENELKIDKMTKQEAYEKATAESMAENPLGDRMDVIYLAMDIYARQKWDEACQLQINSCLENLTPEFHDSLAYGQIASAPKPEFKP